MVRAFLLPLFPLFNTIKKLPNQEAFFIIFVANAKYSPNSNYK